MNKKLYRNLKIKIPKSTFSAILAKYKGEIRSIEKQQLPNGYQVFVIFSIVFLNLTRVMQIFNNQQGQAWSFTC